MRLRIHRGTREIGGTCVELENSGYRVLLDLGLPLDADDADAVPLPEVAGLAAPDPSLLAIILSHGHRDHWGLLPKVLTDVPLIMGRSVERIMRAAADFVPDAFAPKASSYLENGNPLHLGPFTVIPWLVDHSGFDAYALEITAGGRRLFYSGDLRAHGRKGKLFERLVAHPPRDVDVMLMEGSSLGRLPDDGVFQTEEELEQQFVARFDATPGMALVACSAQNIDRVVTIYRAAKRTGRTLIVDAYATEILKATGYDSIPRPEGDWSNIVVFIPQAQRISLKKRGIASIVDSYRGFRLWPEQLAELASRSVMLFRGWMLKDLERANALDGARVFWSQWEGYLKDGGGQKLKQECAVRNIPFEVIHTSGHATPGDLKRIAAAIAPKRLIPIHTFERLRFPDLFENVLLADDGQWIEV
ncbi:MAG TPA: MBL fold metallo-hydrolase [Xanthobacteraceae bacterium]